MGLQRQRDVISNNRIILSALLAFLGLMAAFAQPLNSPGPLGPPSDGPFTQYHGTPEFTFVRLVYTGLGPSGYYKAWYTDWPKSDRQFILGVRSLTNIRVAAEPRTIAPTDPEMFDYPFIYSVECGHWNLTEQEVTALREYLNRGGFLFCDDFWGSWEWTNFERQISRILPGSKIVELPMSHPIFHSYYNINRIVQIPNVGNAMYSDQTHEQDGFHPHCRGIFDERGRLVVIINWNTDLGDAWEWADLPGFPARYSTYAYQIGINAIVYAMSH